MNAEYSFRLAKPDDIQTIKNVARQVITSNYTSFLGEEAVQNFIGSGLSDKEIDNGMEHCTLMICNGGIIGFSIMNDSLLHLIMICTAFQNKGYGSKLLAYIEDVLFKEHKTIHLQSFKENIQAVRFYLKTDGVFGATANDHARYSAFAAGETTSPFGKCATK